MREGWCSPARFRLKHRHDDHSTCRSFRRRDIDPSRTGGRAGLPAGDGLEWVAEGEPTSPDGNRDLIASGIVLVAEEDGVIVGFVAARMAGLELHVVELSVVRKAQGRGIGAALMHAIEAVAIARQADALTLTTFRDLPFNERFYARLGFERLNADALDERLRAILASEAERGLPADRRCAMRKQLLPIQ